MQLNTELEKEMTLAKLEHVNFTVEDAKETSAKLCDLFDWKVRWEGASMDGAGYTMHIGADDFYLAVYSPTGGTQSAAQSNYLQRNGLNHIAVTVDDIDAMEKKVIDAGYKPKNHADYEPGKRFYFHNEDGVEFEVVSYQ